MGSKLKTASKVFMRISDEVRAGMSKAKNAPAREYAKNPIGKGGNVGTKGLPLVVRGGSVGKAAPKDAPKLNAGAQRAKDLADSRRAAAARQNAGNLKGIPAKRGKLTTAQKVVGGVVGAIAAGGLAINADRKLKAATASGAKAGSSRRGGAPMAGKRAPAKTAPASAVSRGGGSAVKNKPSASKAPAKKAPSKATSAPAKAPTPTMSSTPTIGGKTFEQMQSDYEKSGQKSYDEHVAYFNSGEVQKVNKASDQPKQKWYKRKYK